MTNHQKTVAVAVPMAGMAGSGMSSTGTAVALGVLGCCGGLKWSSTGWVPRCCLCTLYGLCELPCRPWDSLC